MLRFSFFSFCAPTIMSANKPLSTFKIYRPSSNFPELFTSINRRYPISSPGYLDAHFSSSLVIICPPHNFPGTYLPCSMTRMKSRLPARELSFAPRLFCPLVTRLETHPAFTGVLGIPNLISPPCHLRTTFQPGQALLFLSPRASHFTDVQCPKGPQAPVAVRRTKPSFLLLLY